MQAQSRGLNRLLVRQGCHAKSATLKGGGWAESELQQAIVSLIELRDSIKLKV